MVGRRWAGAARLRHETPPCGEVRPFARENILGAPVQLYGSVAVTLQFTWGFHMLNMPRGLRSQAQACME